MASLDHGPIDVLIDLWEPVSIHTTPEVSKYKTTMGLRHTLSCWASSGQAQTAPKRTEKHRWGAYVFHVAAPPRLRARNAALALPATNQLTTGDTKKRETITTAMLDRQKIECAFRKAIAFNSHPTEESFPELPTVLLWLRFGLAAGYGCMLGYQGTRSFLMLIQTLNLLAFVPVMYCRLYLRASEDTFRMQTVFSGLFQAIALALLLWIYGFTAAHESQVEQLNSLLLANPPTSDVQDAGVSISEATPESLPVEDEF
jgi:hypothetical protein